MAAKDVLLSSGTEKCASAIRDVEDALVDEGLGCYAPFIYFVCRFSDTAPLHRGWAPPSRLLALGAACLAWGRPWG